VRAAIVFECLLLWAGTVDHYRGRYSGDLTQTVVHVGVHSAIPTAMLLFVLLMLADFGAEEIAVLLGGIIALSYLMDASTVLNDIVDAMLQLSGYPAASGGASSDK
jgi:hypothetical protein